MQKYNDDAHTIKGNCDNWVFLTSREFDLLEEISKLCGDSFYKDSDGSTKSRPLISISELQRFKKEYGEALILHGRNYPFVTELPDIDEYKFKTYPPIATKDKQLPEIVRYDVNKVINAIINKERAIPFSIEVHGEEKYYITPTVTPEKKNLFDW
jgi:type IV secretion system protein VirD4